MRLNMYIGGLAQLVERVLSMHEVSGSIPEFSNIILILLDVTGVIFSCIKLFGFIISSSSICAQIWVLLCWKVTGYIICIQNMPQALPFVHWFEFFLLCWKVNTGYSRQTTDVNCKCISLLFWKRFWVHYFKLFHLCTDLSSFVLKGYGLYHLHTKHASSSSICALIWVLPFVLKG